MIEIVQRVLTEYWCEFMVARSEESGNQEQWSNFVGESLEDWRSLKGKYTQVSAH